jgi:hypothetical protein
MARTIASVVVGQCSTIRVDVEVVEGQRVRMANATAGESAAVAYLPITLPAAATRPPRAE